MLPTNVDVGILVVRFKSRKIVVTISSATHRFTNDPDNVTFIELATRISDFNVTQQEISRRLEISPGQLSRIKSGERHAAQKHVSALRNYIRELKKEHDRRQKESAPSPGLNSLFSIDQGVLRRLSAKESVEAFRDLLWARALARGVPTTLINISSEIFHSDGGVDASISDSTHPGILNDDLLAIGSKFQIKTGDFAPWHESQIKKELFGKRSPSFESLGSGIQEMLREGKRYVLVCFGVDPLNGDIQTARKHIKAAFRKCGFPNTSVEVWGQSHLIGLFRQYPSLCLRLRGCDQSGFRSLHSWAQDADMLPTAHYSPEQQSLLEELRNGIRCGEIGHLRLIGEPGIGKTRLALELSKAPDMSPATLYVRDGGTLLESSLFNELLQNDDHRFAVLVVDECSNRDRAEIWNVLKPRCHRLRMISIDHGPDESADDKTRTIDVERLASDEVVEILRSYGIDEHESKRWAEYCEGCPRVAHVLGDNLRMNRTDLLQPPGIVDVWERFIVGHDDPNSREVEERKLVLRHLALFEKFGYEAPVQNEAKFIAELVQNCDLALTWRRFQEIVHTLRQRRIVQGAKTLYITPRSLQIHLFCQFWEVYGSSFEIAEALATMPQEMWNWFAQTLRYAHNCRPAQQAVDDLLERESFFQSGEFPEGDNFGKLINVLCETSPKSALRCLQRTIGQMSEEYLRRVDAPRQQLVWAVEKIAVWEDCFDGAARLLLKLAEAENATNSNNSTGVFKQLFSLIPSLAATQAPPARRLSVLRDALDSLSAKQRRLGLDACATALDTFAGFRMVGPEHQGLRKKIEFWMPTTYGELWEAHRKVWQLLTDKLELWAGEDRRELIDTIVSSSWSAIHIPPLTDTVIDTLRIVASDPLTNIGSLNEFVKRQLRNKDSKLPEDAKRRLQLLGDSLDGSDFSSRLRRFVKFVTWEDYHDDEHSRSSLVESNLDELADEAVSNPALLRKELSWLVCEASNPAYSFGFRLSGRDPELRLFPEVLAEYAAQHPKTSPLFLGGYLAAVFRRDARSWESVMMELAENSVTADRFSDFVISSGMTDAVARQVIVQCRNGTQSRQLLERWWFDSLLSTLTTDVVRDLIELQLEGGSAQLWSNAVQMCHTFFLEKGQEKPLPEELVFRLLTHDSMTNGRAMHNAGYYWSNLARAFLRQHPGRIWNLFQNVLSVGVREWSVLGDLNFHGGGILTELLREDPTTAFQYFVAVYGQSEHRDLYSIGRWLSGDGHRAFGDNAPGPIQHIPSKLIFAWVDEDPENRGGWLAGILPKTLDESVAGRLTRDFVASYGHIRSICSSLYVSFHSGSWCGNASDHYRKLRDDARNWLIDEDNSTVTRWVEDYIEGLSSWIERAEMEEEREF